MKITKLQAYEIFDSRGIPTIECHLTLDYEILITASVPSGLSKGKYEAYELRDNEKRLMGLGVKKAINNIETIIAPVIIGQQPDVVNTDQLILQLDGTDYKKNLGANAMLAVSIAVLKAQAILLEVEPYELIAQLCDLETLLLPLPLFNFINGGKHARNRLRIQEFMIMPVGARSFREALEIGIEFNHVLKEEVYRIEKMVCIGDEGGYAPLFEDDTQVFDLLINVINKLGGKEVFKIAIDVAASQFYDIDKKIYQWKDTALNSIELQNLYEKFIESYPICSIEDPFAEDDWDAWIEMTAKLGDKIQIVGDDLFATNPERIYQGSMIQAANAAIIKPNQVGTVTETLQSIQLCKEYNLGIIISHRSGETNDSFIADLAVGSSAGQIKAGGCMRGERLAKYNRLLTIEDQLAQDLLE
ncbi:MAG: phosphopyruvate hydratase [Candidatus Babeliales bacterium]